MADFTTANLPGANEKFNTIRNKFTSLKTSLKSNMEVDASSLVSTLQSDLSSFGSDFGFPRKAQSPLSDNIALNLIGPCIDSIGATE